MAYKILPIAMLAGAVFVSVAGQAKILPALKSVTVELPDKSQTFPSGPGSNAADNNCRSCHSVEMVLNQPAMTKVAWEAEVNKMRNVYKAPLDANDLAPIVDYLTQIKGVQ